jgi:uncharacterized protein (TIGR03437 family)
VRVSPCIFLICCCGAANPAVQQSGALGFEARHSEYVAHGRDYSVSLSSAGAVLSTGGHTIRMVLAGANPKSSLQGLDHMPGKASYIFGAQHATYDLFGRVRWAGIHSGIDAIFRGNQELLEYDFDIAARADPRRIRIDFSGVDEMHLAANGDLVLHAGGLEIRQPKPFAYQIVAGTKQPVDVDYRIGRAHQVRFHTGAYDRESALVIDPSMIFDQTFGGSGNSIAAGLAREAQGNLYVAGSTTSPDFPLVNALESQLTSTPLATTVNGGKTWSNLFLGPAIVVNAIVAAPSAPSVVYVATNAGIFRSSDNGATFSATAGKGLLGQVSALAVDAGSSTTLYAATPQGIFVSTDGASHWQASTNGISGRGITVLVAHPTQAGAVFAGVQNPSALFRSTNNGLSWTELNIPAQLANPISSLVVGVNGAMVAGTYIGPLLLSPDGGDTWSAGANLSVITRQALAMSPADPSTVYLVFNSAVMKSTDGGQTFSTLFTFPVPQQYELAIDPRNPSTVYAAAFDVLYRSTNAGQSWSPLSLPYAISPNAIFVSPANSALTLGAAIQNNVFVTKWSPDGSQILYSTYFGGAGNNYANGIAVDPSGSAYITGFTSSTNFPVTPGAYQFKSTGSGQPVFVAKLSPDGSQLAYAALLGSGAASIAVDSSGEAVIAGSTQGNYPVTPGAFQSSAGSTCAITSGLAGLITTGAAFVTKLSADGSALVYSTLLGGSCATYGNGVATDASGNAWVVGSTISSDFPVTSDALQPKYGGGTYDGDGFLARFSPTGSLEYATYIGGSAYDSLNALTFDPSGNIYLTGETAGLSQPSSPNAYQPKASASCYAIAIGPSFYEPQGNAVVLKLDPQAHSVLGLTYEGAPGCLNPTSIAVDSAGEPWIAGVINFAGNDLPTVDPLELGGLGFISKFSSDFTQLPFSSAYNSIAGLALDSSGFAYVAGTTPNDSAYLDKIDASPSAITINSITPAGLPNLQLFLQMAPGQVIQILGAGLGPSTATPGIVNSGILAGTVAGVQVTFDGVAVPLLSVSAQQIDLVVPFELASKTSTSIQVLYNGAKSNVVQVPVVPINMQVLAVMNEDFTLNSKSNPAKAGSVLELYLAGVGNSTPPSQDGQVNAPPLPPLPLTIQLGWFPPNSLVPNVLPISYAAAANGLAAGIFQVNFAVPPQTENVALQQVIGPNTFTGGASFPVYVEQH